MIGERIHTFQITLTAQEVSALVDVLRNETLQTVIANQCSAPTQAVLHDLHMLLINA